MAAEKRGVCDSHGLVTGPAVAVTSRFCDQHQRDALPLASPLGPGVKAGAILPNMLFTNPALDESTITGPTDAEPVDWFDDEAGAEGTV